MSKRYSISSCYRLLLLSVSLLWALLLHSGEVAAFDIAKSTEAPAAVAASVEAAGIGNDEVLLSEQQLVSEEATPATTVITLQQAVRLQRLFSFAFPADEALPAAMAHAAGAGLLARLFPIVIQPNAP